MEGYKILVDQQVPSGVSGIRFFAENGGPPKPALWTPGALDTSLDSGSTIAINGATALIVGKIDWGAASASEMLTLYTPDVAFNQGPAIAVNSIADLNQASFDQISLLVKEGSLIDEIRLGATCNDVIVATTAADPMITSITAVGGGTWELTLEGVATTNDEFHESAALDFTPGTPITGMTASVGTVSGGSNEVVTTDGSGNATVQMNLVGAANFVRAVGP